MTAPDDVRYVEQLGDNRPRISFADATVRVVDLKGKPSGPVGPLSEPPGKVEFFASASVHPEVAAVVWPNGAGRAPMRFKRCFGQVSAAA